MVEAAESWEDALWWKNWGAQAIWLIPKTNTALGAQHKGWDAQEAAKDLKTPLEISNIYDFSPQSAIASREKYRCSL